MLTQCDVLETDLIISVGRCDHIDIPAVQRIFAAAGDPKSPDLLKWQYADTSGGAYLAIAHDRRGPFEGGVATYAAMSLPFFMNGETGSAIQSFDTLTLASHRGKGLFPALGRAVYELAIESDEWLVFGIPNEAIVRGRQKHLAWHIVGNLPMKLRPFGFRYVKSRLGNSQGGRAEPSSLNSTGEDNRPTHLLEVPEDLHELSSERIFGRLGVHRSAEYLRWRLARPQAHYMTSTFRDPHGLLLAWGVAAVEDKHGGRIGYLMDVMVRPGHLAVGKQAVSELLKDLRASGADLALTWASPGGSLERIIRRHGFTPLPQRIRPIKLYFGFRPLTKNPGALGERLDAWDISYLDSDTV